MELINNDNKILLCSDFIDWISSYSNNKKTLLEIGSGYSTTFFSNIFDKVVSYEDYDDWFDKIDNQIKNNNLKNIYLNKFDKNILHDTKFMSNTKNADFFLIDNSFYSKVSRFDFAKFIHNNKKENSIIILDNGEYNIDAYEFLRENYYCLDFICDRYDNRFTQTTVFFKKRQKEKFKKSLI